MTVALLFLIIIFFLLIGVPIAVALGFSSILFLLAFSNSSLASMAQTLFNAFEGHFTLLAIPFFILASSFMSTGGVAERIIRFSIACVGHLRGGLAIAGVFACMMFAALSGSSPATVVAIGTIVIKAMQQAGYTKEFAAGVICNAGTLGILIPPSIVMVVYAASVDVSVGRMFLAGVIPGIIAGLMLMIAIYIMARIKNMPKGEWAGWGTIAESFLNAFWGLMLIVIIMVGIYGIPGITGAIFTPTEAAAVAAVYAFFVAVFIYRDVGFLKSRPWLRDDEVDKMGLGLRIIIFAVFGFLLHFFLSSKAPDAFYPRSLGLAVGVGWVLLTGIVGWALVKYPGSRQKIVIFIVSLLGVVPALVVVIPTLAGIWESANSTTSSIGLVWSGFLWLAPLLAALLTVLYVIAVFVGMILPPLVFIYSLVSSSVRVTAVGGGIGESITGGARALGRGIGESALAFVPAFFHRDTRKTLLEAGKLTIMLMFIIANALILKQVLTEEQIPQQVANAMLGAGFGPFMFLVIVNVILLIGGQFMEPSGLLVIVAPLVFPIAIELGIDPIHLGIIMVVNMEIGMITPPVGLNLFVTSGVAGMPMMSVVRAALPFLGVLFIFLIMVTYIPPLSTFLPNSIMGPEIITK
jgi:C4-dicarboxylate transporter, DctM subunit